MILGDEYVKGFFQFLVSNCTSHNLGSSHMWFCQIQRYYSVSKSEWFCSVMQMPIHLSSLYSYMWLYSTQFFINNHNTEALQKEHLLLCFCTIFYTGKYSEETIKTDYYVQQYMPV